MKNMIPQYNKNVNMLLKNIYTIYIILTELKNIVTMELYEWGKNIMRKYENSTKKKIREVALELINEKGYENVTLKEICKLSGINKHTFYYYFKSKDEVLKEYYKIPCQLTSYDLADIMTADSNVEKIWLLNKIFVDFVQSSGVSIIKQILIKNLINSDIGTFEFNDEHKQLLKVQIDIIKKGQENGEILNKTKADVLAMILFQQIHANVVRWCLKNGSFDFEYVSRYLFEAILDVSEECRKYKEIDEEMLF